MNDKVKDAMFPSLPYRWGAATDVGKLREENQDALEIEPEAGLFLVADGMGGHRGGATASEIVAVDMPALIETRLHAMKTNSPRAIISMLRKTISDQNSNVKMEGDSESGYKGMGTTVALVLIDAARAYVANLGDSRIYRLRKGRFAQISKDHSVVSELLDAGKITPDQVDDHDSLGQITNYVGMDEYPKPYVRSFAMKKNDRLLLCTDGLTDMLSHDQILDILNAQDDPQNACQILVKAANEAGGEDNITVVIVDWLR